MCIFHFVFRDVVSFFTMVFISEQVHLELSMSLIFKQHVL